MAVRIALAGVDELSRIEPLTRALHDHHRTVDPAIPGVPLRETDAWWSVRRERYRAWLAEPDTFLLVADDDGAWMRATLGAEDTIDTWRQWRSPWQAITGDHTITVRATDGDGVVQTSAVAPPFPSGATGLHQIPVTVA